MKNTILILFVLQCFLSTAQTNYEIYMTEASVLIQEGKHEEANEIIYKALDEYPDSAECYLQLGGNYYFTQEFDLALISLNEALRLDPLKVEAYKYRGLSLHRMNKPAQAEVDYIKFLKMVPNDSLIMLKVGTSLYDQNKLEAAKIVLEKFETRNPEYVEVYFTLGAINALQKNLDSSVLNFSKAISINPTDFLGYYYRARVYYTQGKSEEACIDLVECINLGGYQHKKAFDDLDCVTVLKMGDPKSQYKFPNPPPAMISIKQ